MIVLGNPPYSGGLRLTDEQRADREAVFAQLPVPVQNHGRLDYVSCFLAKAMMYARGSGARCAFVMTNSITQGEQSRSLSPLGQQLGIEINFAHRTFAWTSETPGAANVHVVIVGFSETGRVKGPKRLFEYKDIKGEPVSHDVDHINYWLVDYPDVTLQKNESPLIPGIPGMTVGSQPTDGGYLTITPDQLESVLADPIAAKYVRPFPGAEEMLGGSQRWCLWLPDVQPHEIRSSPVLTERLRGVRESREKSPTPAFRKAANTPHLFTHRKHSGTPFLALPQTSSANRRYIPARYYDENTIVSNKLMLIPECPLWVFGVIESSVWMTWTANFGGRLKSDFNVTADLVYNAFPWPDLDDTVRQKVENHAQKVLEVRERYSQSTLADLYDPVAMPVDLFLAHDELDRTVERAFGLQLGNSERDRLIALMARYSDLTQQDQLVLGKKRRKSVRT